MNVIDDLAPSDRDLDAAEYVLGVLPPERAREIEGMALQDRSIAASVVAWQRRLTPLADVVVPDFPPQELWQRLALATGLQQPFRRVSRQRSLPERVWRSLALWRSMAVLGLVLATGLAVLVLLPSSGPTEPLLVALSPQNSPGPAFLLRVGARGQTTILPLLRVNTPTNRSLELWAVNDGSSTPVSLGLMPGAGRVRLRAPVTQGTRLLVSQEPTGGSTTGAPSGPIVLTGVLNGG